MQNLSYGTYTFYESTLKGSPSLVLRLIPMDDSELPLTLQALRREDLLLHFPTSAQAQTYRMWKTDLGHVSSQIRGLNSATSTLNNPIPESVVPFNGTSFATRAISIFANPVIFTLALLAYVLINSLGLMILSKTGILSMEISIASLV